MSKWESDDVLRELSSTNFKFSYIYGTNSPNGVDGIDVSMRALYKTIVEVANDISNDMYIIPLTYLNEGKKNFQIFFKVIKSQEKLNEYCKEKSNKSAEELQQEMRSILYISTCSTCPFYMYNYTDDSTQFKFKAVKECSCPECGGPFYGGSTFSPAYAAKLLRSISKYESKLTTPAHLAGVLSTQSEFTASPDQKFTPVDLKDMLNQFRVNSVPIQYIINGLVSRDMKVCRSPHSEFILHISGSMRSFFDILRAIHKSNPTKVISDDPKSKLLRGILENPLYKSQRREYDPSKSPSTKSLAYVKGKDSLRHSTPLKKAYPNLYKTTPAKK